MPLFLVMKSQKIPCCTSRVKNRRLFVVSEEERLFNDASRRRRRHLTTSNNLAKEGEGDDDVLLTPFTYKEVFYTRTRLKRYRLFNLKLADTGDLNVKQKLEIVNDEMRQVI